MRLTSAILCDFAQVRDGLLFVSSGGVTQISRPAFPAEMTVFLALSFLIEENENPEHFNLKVSVEAEGGTKVGEVGAQLGFQHAPDEAQHQAAILHLPIPMQGVRLPTPGTYSLRIDLDGEASTNLPFYLRAGEKLPDDVDSAGAASDNA